VSGVDFEGLGGTAGRLTILRWSLKPEIAVQIAAAITIQ
jgi:hypothetical protein